MPFTPNRNYPYPTDEFLAKVPQHLKDPLEKIDADVQTVVDGLAAKADAAQVEGDLSTIRSDVAALPTVSEVEAIAEEQAVLHGTPPGSIPVFPTKAQADAWMAANPGRVALTTEAPPDPAAWNATAPVFDVAGRTYTIPTDAGATYKVNGAAKAAGRYPVGKDAFTADVEAVAKGGYTLTGTTQWSQSWTTAPASPYAAVASQIGVEHFYAMDDAAGTPKDTGTGTPLTVQWVGGAPTYGVTGIGGFAQSIEIPSTVRLQHQSVPPGGIPAYTYATILRSEADRTIFADWNAKNRVRSNFASGGWVGTGPTEAIPFTPVPPKSTVQHVALTWDGSTSRLYIDGVQIVSKADPGPVAAAAALKIFDSGGATAPATAAGIIVDHTKALTAAQIKSLSDSVVR